jgi:hypothetical protein
VGLYMWRFVLDCICGGACRTVYVEVRVGLYMWRFVWDCICGGSCGTVHVVPSYSPDRLTPECK